MFPNRSGLILLPRLCTAMRLDLIQTNENQPHKSVCDVEPLIWIISTQKSRFLYKNFKSLDQYLITRKYFFVLILCYKAKFWAPLYFKILLPFYYNTIHRYGLRFAPRETEFEKYDLEIQFNVLKTKFIALKLFLKIKLSVFLKFSRIFIIYI